MVYTAWPKKRGLNTVLWPLLGVAAWFGGQFVGLGILGAGGGFYDEGEALAYSLVGAIVCSVLCFIALELVYRNKQSAVQEGNDEVMDDQQTFDL